MKNAIILLLLSCTLTISGATYYVSPGGSDSNPGTIAQPFFTLKKAWTVISAGDIVYLRGGTYFYPTNQELTGKNGTAGNLIKIWAYPGETPIITKAGSFSFTHSAGIYFIGDYFHWKGITITGFKQIDSNFWGGMRADGSSHNIFETLNVHHNGHGFACVGITGNCDDNLFLDCDFHHNYDPLTPGDPYGNADGLEIGEITSTSSINTVRGCRSWKNSDDGYDMWANNGFVLFDGCWSWHNGYREDGVTNGGDGDGFKLGITSDHHTTHLRTIQNSLAFDNKQGGFAQNEAVCITWLFNNTAYHNATDPAGWDLGFEFADANDVNILKNNAAFGNQYPSGTQANYTNAVHTNNTWDGVVNVTDADFVSIDTSGVSGARGANGTLPNLNFLKLVAGSALIDAGIDVGLPFIGKAPDLGAYEMQSGSTVAIPVYVSAVVENATPALLEMTYNMTLASNIPATSSFSVLVNSAVRAVNSVTISGTKVQLTLSSAIKFGDIVTVSYTKPATNSLQSSTGGVAENISAQSTTNNLINPANDAPIKITMTISPRHVHNIINLIFTYSATPTTALSPEIIRISDLSGKLLIEKFLVTGVTSIKVPLNLNSGIYTVTLSSGGLDMASQRIVVY